MEAPESMRQFVNYHRNMFVFMAGVCLLTTGVLFLALPGESAWAGGFAVGATAQLLKFGFVDIATVRKIAVDGKSAAATQLKASFFSLVIFALAAALVLRFGLNVWTMAAGIFVPRLLLLADAYIRPNPFGGDSGGRE